MGEWETSAPPFSHSPIRPFSSERRAPMLKKAATIASLPVLLLAARFVPWERIPSTCVFYHLTGLPCPTCGITRSVAALAHLDFHRSVPMHPFGVPAVVLFGLWWMLSLYEIAIGKRTRVLRWARERGVLLAVIGFALVAVFGAIRVWLLVRGG